MNLPKTPRGISNKITRIRSQLSSFKREYGFIDDGGGARYYLFYLYLLLEDNRRSSEYFRWYDKQFPDDSGEPIALLCWAIMLNRMGKDGSKKLAETMLSNIYLIPHILNEKYDFKITKHSSNWREEDIVEHIPDRITEAINDEDKKWISELYNSEKFKTTLNRHVEIELKLEETPVGDTRTKLVNELYSLLDDWK